MKDENTYIMNLEACYLYKDIINDKKLTYKNRDLNKVFSATIPYSLETLRMDRYFKDTFYELNGKQYTRSIINITFDKHYTVWEENKNYNATDINNPDNKKGINKIIARNKKIRKYLYNNGFIMDDIKYVFYKRGAGKAKNGYAFFIDERMRNLLINKSRLGLEFLKNEEVDLTSLLAYESLISSGIDFTIHLNPKTEILLIDDIYGTEFNSLASVTRETNKMITTENEIIKIQNCLTDGQGLLDESVFEQYSEILLKKYKCDQKGFMLLRNDMFKCCAFNTKLKKWFSYNNITELYDMFGNKYDPNKIKLVTTPNSVKFLKFAYKFTISGTKKEYDELSQSEKLKVQQRCYKYLIDTMEDVFGVVKCDKDGNYGSYNRTTYQLLNSIPNLSYEELMDITSLEREYVMLLKNDTAVFRNYLGCDAKASLKFEKDLDDGNLNLYENTDLMNALLLVNSDIQYTKKFKKMKSDLIANYIKHLREGKIRLKDTKYVTLFSNPYEMLLSTIGKYNNQSIMKGREVYCKFYEDGLEFCASRNPHINAGNVMYTKNVYHNEYDEWFNLTDNICAINFYDNDAPDRLQGCDTDSDVFLLIPNSILSTKAKYCEEHFATPINKVKGSSLPRKYTMNEITKLDIILSNNYIGKIVNMSQIINSYLNHAISLNEDISIINELYQASSRLSSMSQIEIDKSKKVFDNINMGKELTIMRKLPYIKYQCSMDKYNKECTKMVVPDFFKNISSNNEYRLFEKFNTPLDILQDVLIFKGGNRYKDVKHLEMKDLLIKPKELNGRYSTNSAIAIFNIIQECGKRINGLKLAKCTLSNNAKKTIERKSKREAIEKLKKLNPNDATILGILKQSFGINDLLGFKKYSILTLNLLFMAKKVQVLKCFKNNNMNMDEVLVKIKENSDYEIFGEKFQKVTRKDILI